MYTRIHNTYVCVCVFNYKYMIESILYNYLHIWQMCSNFMFYIKTLCISTYILVFRLILIDFFFTRVHKNSSYKLCFIVKNYQPIWLIVKVQVEQGVFGLFSAFVFCLFCMTNYQQVSVVWILSFNPEIVLNNSFGHYKDNKYHS